MAWWWSK